ncbi:MAG: hypothetical protein JWR69_2071 [Pedosphaera sp.]|nr:hypothetical protein [Pedosphaera sp.]
MADVGKEMGKAIDAISSAGLLGEPGRVNVGTMGNWLIING